MTLLKIAQIGHPVLRERAATVSEEELASDPVQRFIDDLIETMRDANGAGLAANQVYRPIRICAIEVGDNPRYPYKPKVPLTVVVNPVVTPLSDERFSNFEGCLSVPDLRGRVLRHAEIRLQGLDRHGQPMDREIRGLTAGTFQHELDHLDGRLFVDQIEAPETLCTWAHFQAYHFESFAREAEALVKRWGG